MIGNVNFQNQKLGSEAIRALTKYAHTKLELDQLHLYVYKFNKRAIHVYEKCGFEKDEWKDDKKIKMVYRY